VSGSAVPAPPSPPADSNSGLDLFGGGGNNASNSTAPKSNFDLLGGLEMAGGQGGGGGVMSSLPPLVSSSGGLNQSGPTNVMMMQQQPTKPQTNSSALLFDSATLSLQPTLQATGGSSDFGGFQSSTAAAQRGAEAGSKPLPSTWNDVGKLNLDLANFSLTSKSDKKASVSMNAMKGSGSGSTPAGSNPMSPQSLSPQHNPQNPQMGGGGSAFDLL